MYSSLREDDAASSASAHDLADALSVGVQPTLYSDIRGSWTTSADQQYEQGGEVEEGGGRGGDTTIESPFKDPSQLQSQPQQSLTRLPSFAALTHPLGRFSGSSAPSSNGGGSGSVYSNGHPDSDHSAAASPALIDDFSNPLHLLTNSISDYTYQPNPSQVSDPYFASYGLYGSLDASSSSQYDTSHRGGPTGAHNGGDGMNAAVKRAREGSAGSGSDGRSSPRGANGKPVTTQKTREAGMTRRKVEARFICPVDGCGSTFTRSHNLSGHLRSHADERPFKCPSCGRGFARQHDCKRHARLHVPESANSFECFGCNKKFARSDGLAQHQMRTDVGKECLRTQAAQTNPTGADDDLYVRPFSPEPWANNPDGEPLTMDEERAILEAAVLEYIRLYPSTLLDGPTNLPPSEVTAPFPSGLTPPELLVWISHSPFPEMAKDPEVLRIFGKLIGLPSSRPPREPKSEEEEDTSLIYDDGGEGEGLVLDPALMGEGRSAEGGKGKSSLRCDYVHPISGERCQKVFSRMYDCRRHFEAVHASKSTSGFHCDECQKRFSREDALARHISAYCTSRKQLADASNLLAYAQAEPYQQQHQEQDFQIEYEPYVNGDELGDYPGE